MAVAVGRFCSLQFHGLTRERRDDFEILFGRRGACSGCWCMWWRSKRKVYEVQSNRPPQYLPGEA